MANPKDWTIMVYMAGDNNLSDNMAISLKDMGSVRPAAQQARGKVDGGRGKVNLLAFFDGNSLTAPTQYIDFSEKQVVRQEVLPEDLHFRHMRRGTDDPKNSGTAYSILNFIRWCVMTKGKKASNYALIFSGHSFGFYGKGFLADQSSGSYLTLRRLRWALEYASANIFKKKIAIVGFDSCEMGMLEVSYELRRSVQTVIASEGTLPSSGWGYAPVLKEFFERPQRYLENDDLRLYYDLIGPGAFERKKTEGKDIRSKITLLDTAKSVKTAASYFVKGFIDQQKDYSIGGRSVDMAAWDLEEKDIDALAKNVGELGKKLCNGLGYSKIKKDKSLTTQEEFIFNRTKAAILQSRVNCQSYMHEQAVDLKDFCQFLRFESKKVEAELKRLKVDNTYFVKLSKLCKKIIDGVDNCILASGFAGDEFQFSHGISLYFPWTALTHKMTDSVYRELMFVWGDRKKVSLDEDKKDKSDNRVALSHGPDWGPGIGWNDFLRYYLYLVTLRLSPNQDINATPGSDGLANGTIAAGSWSATRENWLLGTKENWLLGTKENWQVGTRENWRLGTRENILLGTKEDWRQHTKENWRLATKEQLDNSIGYFDRIKNFQLNWQANGFTGPIAQDNPEQPLEKPMAKRRQAKPKK